MASERRQGIAARLQDLYRVDDTARALFDDAAERSYSVARTSVDRIARIVGTTHAKAVVRLEDPDNDVEQRGAIAPSGEDQRRPFIEHRFPLREDRIVVLQLPIDLTKEEADRLSNFIAALAQPD